MNRWLRVVLEALLFAFVVSCFLCLALVFLSQAQDAGWFSSGRK